MDLSALIREARGKRSRDALGRETGLTGKAIENYEIRGRAPELLPLVRIALAAEGPVRMRLLKFLPAELRRVAAAMVEMVCEENELDRPDTILESLRAGLAASPPSPAEIETSAVKRQTTRAQEIFANEDKSPQQQQRKRKRRRTKVA